MIFSAILLVLAIVAGCSPEATASDSNADAFVRFLRSNAELLRTIQPDSGCADLEFLGSFVSDATIVGFGESRHDGHELAQIKRRLIECLITEHRFTHVVLEAGLTHTARLDAYVRSGSGNPNALVSAMGNWELFDNEESRSP